MNKNLAIAIGESIINLGVAYTGSFVIGKKLGDVIKDPKIANNQKIGWTVGSSLLCAGVSAACFWINTKIWDKYTNKEYEDAVSEYNNNNVDESKKSEESSLFAEHGGLGVVSEELAEKIKKAPEMTMEELENL